MKIREICNITMGQSPSSATYNENGDGLPFFQGAADFGKKFPMTRVWCSSPLKIAYAGDILISVRAPVGTMNIATSECCIGRGLAAIKIDEDACDSNYFWFALESKISELNNKGSGSTFKAISKSILEETEIPLPELEEQRKIAKILTGIENISFARQQQLAKLDELVKARFVEMFGDPVSNSLQLPEKKLAELGEFGRGVSKHRPRNDPALLGGKYPLIQTGEVASADVYITSYQNSYSELGFQQSKLWKKGTLCITIAANIAKTAILGFDACFPDSVVGFNANEKTNEIFIHYWFSFFQAILEAQAPESAQKNINLKILGDLKVIVPDISAQTEFVSFVIQIEKTKLSIQRSLGQMETLKKALMQQYFG